jgi:DNA-directed RNA polymerase subunit RPC12/RpoP
MVAEKLKRYKLKCLFCGNEFKSHKKTQKCCSRNCQFKRLSVLMKNRKPHNYIGKTEKGNGYFSIAIGGNKRISYHKYILEQSLGIKIPKNLVVHHIDGDQANNSLDNLQLMTRSTHMKIHNVGKNTRFKKGEISKYLIYLKKKVVI